MKNKLSRMLGFTMIELLVVIAVIGVLAVAVLSAINPLEQINKGRDTRTRSDAAELLNAVDRYFTTQELFPWNKSRTTGTNDYTASVTDPEDGFVVLPATEDDTKWNWIANMSDVSEVKATFTQRLVVNNEMLLYKDDGGATDPVTVCFLPTSNQFKLEAARKCCPTATCADDVLAGTTAETVTIGPTTVTLCGGLSGVVVDEVDNFICLP